MSESTITAITKFLELAPRYLAVVAIATGVVLFAPAESVKSLGLSEIAQNYRPWIGGTFLISSGIVVISALKWIGVWTLAFGHAYWVRKSIAKRLRSLTEDEKQILRFYVAENTRANMLKVDDGIVQGLVSANIIYRSTQLGNLDEGFAHNISDFVWKHLHKHPNLLVGTTTTYRTDKRRGLW